MGCGVVRKWKLRNTVSLHFKVVMTAKIYRRVNTGIDWNN